MVENSPQHPKVKGLSLTADAGNGREKKAYKIVLNKEAAVAQWWSTCLNILRSRVWEREKKANKRFFKQASSGSTVIEHLPR